jgi:hypothetical protein
MTENSWKKLAEENELDCTLKRVEIECVLQHEPVSGDDFMPYGWCGECETCNAWPNPDVCEACSYTKRYDLRLPVLWPCPVEQTRLNAERREEHMAELAKIRATKQKGF